MKTYVVASKANGAEVYRYQSDAPVEWAGMEFSTHDHTELVEVTSPAAPGWEVLDVIDYLKLFKPEERRSILQRAKTDPVVEDILVLQNNTPRVRSDDKDLLDALDYLTFVGDLAPGRKQEILNG